MKTMILALWLALVPQTDTLRVLFWNLENLFDSRNDSTSVSDAEFSARGARHWNRKRFTAKCNAIAKGILWAGEALGGLPDAIGVAEVENRYVLRRLLEDTALRKLDYRLVHFDSPDARGIDVALLYRSTRLQLDQAKPCHLYGADSSVLATRDILLARFWDPGGEPVALLVNHHPSKYGGTEASQQRREIAVARLGQLADSLQAAGVNTLVAMGDFNDTPDNPLYQSLPLENLGLPLHQAGEGSIKYEGKWELIDLFFVSRGLHATMQVLVPPFLTVRDATYGGTKPLRTYSGPRYLGGVSDHYPVCLKILRHSVPQDDK